MIMINKSTEPIAWTEKKSTPGFTEYEPISELRNALLEEQGYICAYCMRWIPVKDTNIDATSKIEHLKSREDSADLQLDYNNMVICCPGNMDNERHCDNRKGRNSITFDPFTDNLQNTIKYKSKDGDIYSTNNIWNEEINNMLNLNHSYSKINRKKALDGIIDTLNSKGWNRGSLANQLDIWSNLDTKGKLKPYCGIVIWYLQKGLKQKHTAI